VQARREQRENEHVGQEDERIAVGEQRHDRQGGDRNQRELPGSETRTFYPRSAARFGERPAEQPPRTQHEHDRHDDELGDQRDLGVAEADAEGLDLADEQRSEKRAGDRAHAADHHHDECIGDHGEIDLEIGRLARDGERATQPGKRGAERKDDGEEPALIDPERADHLAVLGRGADQDAEAGSLEQDMKEGKHRRTERDEEQVVLRKLPTGDGDRAGESRRTRAEHVLGAPGPEGEVLDDEHEGERGKQLQQLGRPVDAPQ
jgi:hypothetical protein